MELALQVRGLQVTYPNQVRALAGVDLDLVPGEVLLVLGASGSGKSTLIHALAGLIPDLFPAEVEGTLALPAGWRVSAVLQNLSAQIFTYRVESEVAFGPENLGLSIAEVRQRTDEALSALDLANLRPRLLTTLSSGQLQRTVISSLIAMRPTILVFDEPTANLDRPGRETFYRLLGSLRSTGTYAIVLVEHRIEAALQVASRVLLLDRGRSAGLFTPEELRDHAALLHSLGIRQAGLLQAPASTPPVGRPVLQFIDVSAGLGSEVVLRDVNLAVAAGEIVAVTGPNGVGKTTLAFCAAGLIRPVQGSVLVAGSPLDPVPTRQRPSLVGLVMQDSEQQLFGETVEAELRFGTSAPGADEIERVLQQVGLSDLRDRHPLALSHGEKQRLVVASVVARRPRLLVLDEPTSALDGRNVERLAEILDQLRHEGIGILVVSHDWEFARAVSNRVVDIREIQGTRRPEPTIHGSDLEPERR
jgi:energy-coupling factor transporter ATP-binding protein EcfA2